MKTRNSALYALGLAAAITLGSAFEANAQAKTKKPTRRARPAQRIPVRKDVPVQSKTDTVIVTRVDTVTVRRVDTLTGPTVMRYDTVTRMVYPPLQRLPGLFFGLGAGATIPMNNIRALVKDGWGAQGQVGFFPMNSPLGLRADATYGTTPARDKDCPICKDAKVWSVGGDVILRMPLDRTSKLNPVLYVFGGGGYMKFSDVDPLYTSFLSHSTEPVWNNNGKLYYDVGPGVDFNVGGLHLYAEGKYITMLTDREHVHLFPVYGGIKFY